jgi:hypothetical protein
MRAGWCGRASALRSWQLDGEPPTRGTPAIEVRTAGTRQEDVTTVADVVMVIPVYGADQYDERTRRRISYYEFTNLFYLPADTALRFEEGYARLDHVQPCLPKPARAAPRTQARA